MIKVRRLLFYAFAAAALVFCFESTKGMAHKLTLGVNMMGMEPCLCMEMVFCNGLQ